MTHLGGTVPGAGCIAAAWRSPIGSATESLGALMKYNLSAPSDRSPIRSAIAKSRGYTARQIASHGPSWAIRPRLLRTSAWLRRSPSSSSMASASAGVRLRPLDLTVLELGEIEHLVGIRKGVLGAALGLSDRPVAPLDTLRRVGSGST